MKTSFLYDNPLIQLIGSNGNFATTRPSNLLFLEKKVFKIQKIILAPFENRKFT